MDKKTAQRLIHRHLHETQAVPWINEKASQKAFPFGAAVVQFVLSEGTNQEAISKLCYDLTALLGGVAAHLRQVTPTLVNRTSIEAIVQRSTDLLALDHKDFKIADTLAVALVNQLSDWGEEGPQWRLAGLFAEALVVVAQTLNCVNNHKAWNPKPSLLEACGRAVEEPESDWQIAVLIAQKDDTWGSLLQEAAALVLDPETRTQYWYNLQQAVESCRKQKCCQCYEPGSERFSCGAYAGRYCDEHWETSGFRPNSDRVGYLDAGEHTTEAEAY